MPKLYTKTGDKGITSLYDGTKLKKGSWIFTVLGGLDELSSHIGVLCVKTQKLRNNPIKEEKTRETYQNHLDIIYPVDLFDYLREIQVNLLDIGSNIATIDISRKKRLRQLNQTDIKKIEDMIDTIESENNKLTEFLLPGTNESDAQCHICRSVTRRVERDLWLLDELNEKVDNNILVYLNRMSDFFFAFSRKLSKGKDITVSEVKKKLKCAITRTDI